MRYLVPRLRRAPQPTPADDSTWAAFREGVHGALVRLHDPPALETHPLAELAQHADTSGVATPGRALRDALLAAINAIGPVTQDAADETRAFRLVRLRYLDGEPIEVIRRQLAIGRSEYFREHSRAVDAIAALLRDRWESAAGGSQSRFTRVAGGRVAVHGARPPRPVTSFVGREHEVSEILGLLRGAHLITLTGSGGVGKTRLALRIAEEMETRPPEEVSGIDVWFVDLSGLDRLAPIAPVVAAALGIREITGQAAADSIVKHLRASPGVLVLDNCEHVALEAARLIEALLEHCANLRILATSREPLRLGSETIYRVPSLTHPQSHVMPAQRHVLEYEAVRLFADRASSILPGFNVVDENARAVIRICQQLDGIPLAVELAAARLRGLSLGQIASRLDDTLRLLASGERTARPRHQTLRAMVDWSHDLLKEPERTLFRRLSVFAGGFTLDAAEVVCGLGEDAFEGLLGLVDKSLVVAEIVEVGHERYRMLEVLRQYGSDQLMRAGEAADLGRQHATYFVELAEAAEAGANGADQEDWYERIDRELDNVRAALHWAVSNDAEVGLRICGALWRYWFIRGHLFEGRERLAALLAQSAPIPDAIRAKALFAAAYLAVVQGESNAARGMAEESVTIDEATERFRESIELARLHGARWDAAMSLEGLASIAIAHRNMSAAARLLGAATSIRTELSSTRSPAEQLDFDARVARVRNTLGDLAFAREWAEGEVWTMGTWDATVSTALALPLAGAPTAQRVRQAF